LLKASCTYLSLSKSGTFGHPAVRIRVKASADLLEKARAYTALNGTSISFRVRDL
jgi:hypothetical protein